MSEIIILCIPFLGTSLGAAMVFFLKKAIHPGLEKLLLGFAAGVMIAASVWSLLIPSIDMAETQKEIAWLPAVTGFGMGGFFLLILEKLISYFPMKGTKPEGVHIRWSKTTMMLFAVTIHNVPEGMSVGAAYAGAVAKGSEGASAAAIALAFGIAIQNIPEGAIISLPLRGEGMSRKKAFLCGVLSGVVEPVGGLATILLAGMITPVLPYLLAFAAGAMFYVVIEELIPESQAGAHSNVGTVGAACGFALMMVLDVALG